MGNVGQGQVGCEVDVADGEFVFDLFLPRPGDTFVVGPQGSLDMFAFAVVRDPESPSSLEQACHRWLLPGPSGHVETSGGSLK